MPQVLAFGVIGRGEIDLSADAPVGAGICCYTSHERISLQILSAGGKLQQVYRIKSGMNEHGAAHILAGSVVE